MQLETKQGETAGFHKKFHYNAMRVESILLDICLGQKGTDRNHLSDGKLIDSGGKCKSSPRCHQLNEESKIKNGARKVKHLALPLLS